MSRNRKTTKLSRIEKVAHHEAGHAVMAVLMKRPLPWCLLWGLLELRGTSGFPK